MHGITILDKLLYFSKNAGHRRRENHMYCKVCDMDCNKVVRDKRTGKTKGYGFVSFASPLDLAAALKEMNGKYVGNRPIKLRKSNWKDRTDFEALKRQKNLTQKKPKLLKKSVLHK